MSIFLKQREKKQGKRYTMCRECRKVWNTPSDMTVPAEKYICPKCTFRRRREKREEADRNNAEVCSSDCNV